MSSPEDKLLSSRALPISGKDQEALRLLWRFSLKEIF